MGRHDIVGSFGFKNSTLLNGKTTGALVDVRQAWERCQNTSRPFNFCQYYTNVLLVYWTSYQMVMKCVYFESVHACIRPFWQIWSHLHITYQIQKNSSEHWTLVRDIRYDLETLVWVNQTVCRWNIVAGELIWWWPYQHDSAYTNKRITYFSKYHCIQANLSK